MSGNYGVEFQKAMIMELSGQDAGSATALAEEVFVPNLDWPLSRMTPYATAIVTSVFCSRESEPIPSHIFCALSSTCLRVSPLRAKAVSYSIT